MTPSAGGCSGSTRSLAYRKARNVMRVVRRFERENETNPREFSSLRPLLRAVDARFEEVFEEVGAWRRDRLGDIQRVNGTLAWRSWGRGHHHARLQGRSQRAQQDGARSAYATHRTSCTARPETRNGQEHMPKQLMSRIDTTRCAGLLTSHGRNSRVTFRKSRDE